MCHRAPSSLLPSRGGGRQRAGRQWGSGCSGRAFYKRQLQRFPAAECALSAEALASAGTSVTARRRSTIASDTDLADLHPGRASVRSSRKDCEQLEALWRDWRSPIISDESVASQLPLPHLQYFPRTSLGRRRACSIFGYYRGYLTSQRDEGWTKGAGDGLK